MVRESGALATLPLALATRMGAHVLTGDLSAAAVLLEPVKAVTEVTGIPCRPVWRTVACRVARPRVRGARVSANNHCRSAASPRRVRLIISGFAQAMLYNSLGRYGDAARVAQIARGYPSAMGVEPWGVLVELVEGAIRSGQSARAHDAFRDLVVTTQAAGSDWALGIEARSRALLSVGADAEAATERRSSSSRDEDSRRARPCTSPVRRMAAA